MFLFSPHPRILNIYKKKYATCFPTQVKNSVGDYDPVIECTLAGISSFLHKKDRLLDRQGPLSIRWVLDTGLEVGLERKTQFDKLVKVVKDTNSVSALDGVFSQIKMALLAGGICLARGSVSPLSPLDEYISPAGDESSDPVSGNAEPMTRSGDRQKLTELNVMLMPMQSAVPDHGISKLSPADNTADKK